MSGSRELTKSLAGFILAVVVVLSFLVGGLSAGMIAREQGPKIQQEAAIGQKVTFNRDIAPIVSHYCASCHRPGEAGPFPLLTYDDLKKHGRQIEAVTQTRFMPPWLPEPQTLKFADERRLSDEQIATIRKWVDQGMLEGKPS